MRRETVRCSLPEAFMAPRTVPTMAQQIPTKAIITMNHLKQGIVKINHVNNSRKQCCRAALQRKMPKI
jgi:hypothetical protein